MESVGDIVTILPAQMTVVRQAWDKYANAASKLSKLRHHFSTQLCESVNEVLPDLEMGEKLISILIQSAYNDLDEAVLDSLASSEIGTLLISHIRP